MNEALTAQRVDVIRRFWDVFAREPVTLERLRGGQLDRLMEDPEEAVRTARAEAGGS